MKAYISIISILVFFVLFSGTLTAQINLRDKIKNQTNNRANNKADQGIDKTLDKVEEGIGNLFKKDKKEEDVQQTAKEPGTEQQQQQQQQQQPTTQEQVKPPVAAAASLQTYSKYDFIPGEKVIFFDDFTETAVGDFPPNWNTTASGEVVTNNIYPGNWFKLIGEGCVAIDGGLKLTDNYTIEFDVIPYVVNADNVSFEYGFYLYSAQDPKNLNEGGAVPGNNGGIKMSFGYRATYSAYNEEGYTINGEKEDAKMEAGKKYRLSFWVQKTRLRMYQDQVKIFDLPKVFKTGMQCNQMRFELWGESAPMITNFRVAAGLPDTRNKLITQGKLVTYGIYFDVNKDVVKPESYGTMKEIATVLNEVPEVKVKIWGHTDSDGQDAANLDLSKRRAASVKAELVKNFGVKADRLDTDGMGETQPVAPNDTPVNKALNRRVEFIKQ
jgi:outer membrane protein OmpA-like peptidoglycan-associated protein